MAAGRGEGAPGTPGAHLSRGGRDTDRRPRGASAVPGARVRLHAGSQCLCAGVSPQAVVPIPRGPRGGVLGAPRRVTWLPPPAQPWTLSPGCFPSPATTRLSRNAPLGVGLGWGGGHRVGTLPAPHLVPRGGDAQGAETRLCSSHASRRNRRRRRRRRAASCVRLSVCLSVCLGLPSAPGIPRTTVPGAAPRALGAGGAGGAGGG